MIVSLGNSTFPSFGAEVIPAPFHLLLTLSSSVSVANVMTV